MVSVINNFPNPYFVSSDFFLSIQNIDTQVTYSSSLSEPQDIENNSSD